METHKSSENLRLAKKISKLVRGGIDPSLEPYAIDDVNILSILTLIYEYLVGEQVMFSSVYEGSKAIEDWIKENAPDFAKESTLIAGIAILLDAINNVDLTEVAKEETLEHGISLILQAISEIDIDTSTLAKEDTLTTGIADIKNDISHIDIDMSAIAKQGSNPDTNITEMDNKLDQLLDNFADVTYANVMEELNIEDSSDDE